MMDSNGGRIAFRNTVVGLFAGLALLATLGSAPSLQAQSVFDAAREGDLEAVRALVEADAELVRAADGSDRTPLHLASLYGRLEVAAFLIDSGADIDAREEDGETPLHSAAWRSRLDVGRMLIERGSRS